MSDHFVHSLGISFHDEAELTIGTIPVVPEMLAPSTKQVRIGLMATMVDMVAGNPPGGPLTPTVDLRIQTMRPAPSTGTIRLECRMLRAGRTFAISESMLFDDSDRNQPFARATTTFLNNKMEGLERLTGQADPSVLSGEIAAMIAPTYLAPGLLEVVQTDRIDNGSVGTIQGGAQATIAELAAEHALADRGPCTITDLDIRYLARLRVGPMLAIATILPTDNTACVPVRVELTDAGRDRQLVSYVTINVRML